MTATASNIIIGLVGQQNAGKSTIFNMLTGANQHIANYPGVTIDKKLGSYRDEYGRVEVVDLPGTYSLTSFSLEERVTRDFLLREMPDAIINVIDASSLRRGLCFTFQVLEMAFPAVMALNMVDIAEANGRKIDHEKLSNLLGIPVVPTIGRKGVGKTELRLAIRSTADSKPTGHSFHVDYYALEKHLAALMELLAISKALSRTVSLRWLAVKLLEEDPEARKLVSRYHEQAEEVLESVDAAVRSFQEKTGMATLDYIVSYRDRKASEIVDNCVKETDTGTVRFSERIDRVLLHRGFAPVFLMFTVYLIYELSIVRGYKLTLLTWPVLAWLRATVAGILPDAGLLHDTILRSLPLWMVDSVNTLLNYVPIFMILFAIIAILEDSGYMARIAFILDKAFHRFGLHGQSTLPFILGGCSPEDALCRALWPQKASLMNAPGWPPFLPSRI